MKNHGECHHRRQVTNRGESLPCSNPACPESPTTATIQVTDKSLSGAVRFRQFKRIEDSGVFLWWPLPKHNGKWI